MHSRQILVLFKVLGVFLFDGVQTVFLPVGLGFSKQLLTFPVDNIVQASVVQTWDSFFLDLILMKITNLAVRVLSFFGQAE